MELCVEDMVSEGQCRLACWLLTIMLLGRLRFPPSLGSITRSHEIGGIFAFLRESSKASTYSYESIPIPVNATSIKPSALLQLPSTKQACSSTILRHSRDGGTSLNVAQRLIDSAHDVVFEANRPRCMLWPCSMLPIEGRMWDHDNGIKREVGDDAPSSRLHRRYSRKEVRCDLFWLRTMCYFSGKLDGGPMVALVLPQKAKLQQQRAVRVAFAFVDEAVPTVCLTQRLG